MNTAELASLNMYGCPRCKCAFPREGFYTRAGVKDPYCRLCRRIVNGNAPRKDSGVTYHARSGHLIPDATRKCRHCGKWLAPFIELWSGECCVFCAQDRTLA